MLIYYKEGESNHWTNFMILLYNKMMQNYHSNFPQKGVRAIYPKYEVTENG